MSDREEIEADIEATREQLAETVSALGEKLDVKSRAKDSAHRATASAKANPWVPAAGAAVLVLGVVLWRRSR